MPERAFDVPRDTGMSGLAVRQIAGTDEGLREALLAAALPVDDLHESGRRFFRFEREGLTIGYGGFEPHGRYVLIRSVVVLPEARGRGNGRAVTESLLDLARATGASEAFLLTTSAASFFEHLSFAEIARSRAPKVILETRQSATICTTATLLQRSLEAV